MDLTQAKTVVEDALGKLGVAPESVLARASSDQVAWAVKRGSAQVLVALQSRDGATALRLVAPVVVFDPARKDALFARVLELNADGLAGCAFGVLQDRVVVVTQRRATGLTADEGSHLVTTVAAVADTWDDKLVAEFGGKRASDK